MSDSSFGRFPSHIVAQMGSEIYRLETDAELESLLLEWIREQDCFVDPNLVLTHAKAIIRTIASRVAANGINGPGESMHWLLSERGYQWRREYSEMAPSDDSIVITISPGPQYVDPTKPVVG